MPYYASKVDQSRFEARFRAMRQRIAPETRRGAVEMSNLFLHAMQDFTHRDTRRYIRSWEMAHNDVARAGGFPDLYRTVSPLRRSQYRDEYERVLVAQYNDLLFRFKAKAGRLQSWYDAKGRKRDRFYNAEKRALERLGNRIDRAAEELDKLRGDAEGTALLIKNVNFAQVAAGEKLSNVDLSTESAALKGRLATVRTKVYGGRGQLLGGGTRWVANLKSLEAHARVVEWRFHTVYNALAVVRGFGVRRIARRVVERIAGKAAKAA